MSSARFLAVLLLLPLAALAQNQRAVPPDDIPLPPLAGSLFPHPDPLTTLPQSPLDSQEVLPESQASVHPFDQSLAGSGNSTLSADAIARLENGEKQYLQSHSTYPNHNQGTIRPGEVCYSIRSYLVARDSKDSDSTHLVGVSNCQPARQYSLKTTDPPPHILQR